MPVLKIIQGQRTGARVPLGEHTTLGRSNECNLCIDNDQASREHAEVVREEAGFVVRDLGSSNGTFVNSTRITQHRLTHGDQIRIGSAVLQFDDPAAAGPAPSAPADPEAERPHREGIARHPARLVVLMLALLTVAFFVGYAAGGWFIRQGTSAPDAQKAPEQTPEAS